MVLKISDPILMREINKFIVLETIRTHGKVSRVEITKLTQLSRTTVSAITGALLEAGLIETSHIDEASRGRPRTNLALVADATYAFGAALTANSLTLTLADFRGDVLITAQHSKNFLALPHEELTEFITSNLLEACAAANIDRRKVNGLCLGISGLLDPQSGKCTPEADFAQIAPHLVQSLHARTGLAVFLENHAELLAHKIHWHDRSGKTCAIVVLNDVLEMCYRPAGNVQESAKIRPALGHTKIRGDGLTCTCGQIDCAQAYLSKSALAQRSQGVFDTSEADEITGSMLTKLSENDAPSAKKLADIFGQSLAHVVNLLQPQTLVAACESTVFINKNNGKVLESLRSNTQIDRFMTTNITFQTLNPQHIALGGTALVLKEFYQAPWISQEAL